MQQLILKPSLKYLVPAQFHKLILQHLFDDNSLMPINNDAASFPFALEQTERMLHRYLWASGYCHQKDVVELACGTGQGLGILKKVSKSIVASDYSDRMINILRGHYGDKISAEVFDATKMPYHDMAF